MDRWSRRQVVQGVGVAGLGLLAGCGRLPWQSQPARIARVGWLAGDANLPFYEAFRRGIHEQGYIEGQNLVLEYRSADGRGELISVLAFELTRLPVDVLVAVGTPETQAAKEATSTVPVVFAQVSDPVASGFVTSLARPGGNITGLTSITPELSAKRLELLREVVPTVTRIGVLTTSDNPARLLDWYEVQSAARLLGLQVELLEVRESQDFELVFEAAIQEHLDALNIFGDFLILRELPRILEFTSKRRLPVMYSQRQFVDRGGLMAYGPSFLALHFQAATYVDKILKGTPPSDLPVQRPREFEFVINLQTAQALGLTIPEHVLLQATEVMQ
jgi:putative ABC transport system substrate-binding protein